MSEEASRDEASMAALRPLSACVAGAGLMTLGVLQFLGQVWSAVPDAARQEMLATVRVSFFGFLLALAALVLAWLGQGAGGAAWRRAITLFGLFAFAGSAYSVALGTGRALSKAAPATAEVLPPGEVQAFMGAGAATLALLVAALAVLAVRRMMRGNEA